MNRSAQTLKLIGALLCVFAILFTACKKKEIQGPKGEPGDPGVGGNANITSTNTFVVNTGSWTPDSAASAQKVTLNFSEITQEVVDKGSVKVYMQDGTPWAELPWNLGDLIMQYGFDAGHLYLSYNNIEGGAPPAAPATARFRLVIVSAAERSAQNGSFNDITKVKVIVK